MKSSRLLRRWLPWVCGYVALLAAVVVGTLQARHWAMAHLSTPESVGNWQAWREDIRQQQNRPGPVQRRVPKSSEPPALVLMRDHFGVSLTAAVLFSGLLYWVFAWFVMGIATKTSDQ